MAAYVEKLYSFSRLLAEHLQDGRTAPQIPLLDIFRCAFLLFAHRLRSLNALEEILRRRGKPFVEKRAPSADTLGYAFSRMDPRGVRRVLRDLCTIGRRKKALKPRWRGLPWTAAVDGHEHFKSFSRHCPGCLSREIKVGEEIRIQYYHRSVEAQLVATEPAMALDLELLGPGEGESTAGRRLIERVMKDHPFIRVFSLDALYLRGEILRPIVEAGRGAIVVLKEERRQVYQDTKGILSAVAPQEIWIEGEKVECWDLPGLDGGEGLEGLPLRVLRTVRHRKARRRRKGRTVETLEKQDWMWATVGLGPEVSALGVHRLGHARWDIENRGFNEQDSQFGIDHCFKHNPTAILNFALTLFVASVLTALFFSRNLKAMVLRRMSRAGLARMFLEHPPEAAGAPIWAKARSP